MRKKLSKLLLPGVIFLGYNVPKVDFGWLSAPDHAGGAYRAPPDPLADGEGLAAPP